MAIIYEDAVGKNIILRVHLDLTDASVMKIKYQKPSGAAGEWNAQKYSAKSIYYVTQTGDIDEVGTWQLQAYVETPTLKEHGEKATLIIGEIIE